MKLDIDGKVELTYEHETLVLKDDKGNEIWIDGSNVEKLFLDLFRIQLDKFETQHDLLQHTKPTEHADDDMKELIRDQFNHEVFEEYEDEIGNLKQEIEELKYSSD